MSYGASTSLPAQSVLPAPKDEENKVEDEDEEEDVVDNGEWEDEDDNIVVALVDTLLGFSW